MLTIKFRKYFSKYQMIYFFAINIKNYNLFKIIEDQRKFSIFLINTNNEKKKNETKSKIIVHIYDDTYIE